MSDWTEFVKKISTEFAPIDQLDGGYPLLSRAVDEGIDTLLAQHIAKGAASVNKRFVEDLLTDCVARVANCQILREKAQEVEARAIESALNYSTHKALLDGTEKINNVLAPVQHMFGANATGAKTVDGVTAFTGIEGLWAEVKEEEKKITAAQRTALESILSKAGTPGNGTNFIERFTFLKELFNLGMIELYGRSLACADAIQKIYGITVPVPNVTPTGYLNQLAIWAQRSSDLLDRELSRRYTGSVIFSLAAPDEDPKGTELLKQSVFKASVGTGTVNFAIKKENLEFFKISDILLRSVRLQVRSTTDDARIRTWPGLLTTPDTDLTLGDENFPCTLSTAFSEGGGETVFGVHNISPIGDWTLRLPARSATADATGTEIANVYIHLRLSYVREGI